MPFWTKRYLFLAATLPLLLTGQPRGAVAASFWQPDSILAPRRIDTVEGLSVTISGVGIAADSAFGRLETLSQTNDAPFLSGPATIGPVTKPVITLSGRTDYSQSGTYTIFWTLVNDSIPTPGIMQDTTTLVVHDLFPPPAVRAFYVPNPVSAQVGNGTGVLSLVVWDGSGPSADPIAWNGYRVRRTIHGVSSEVLGVAGQYVNYTGAVHGAFHTPLSPLCFNAWAPCDPDSFDFTGMGYFFKGFQGNSLGNGKYVIDYPPGAPVDACSDCWVFADRTALAGFVTDYAVTSIGPFEDNDYDETPIGQSPVVTILPATAPADNLERVAVVPNPFKGSAQWDPAVGEGRVHFIHVPAYATVRVFTSSGELVRELKNDPNSSPGGETGDVFWDLRNGEGKKVVSGIYIYQVETTKGQSRKGHFVIIK